MRNLLARVSRHAQPMVAVLVRTVFAQSDQASARQKLEQVAGALERRFSQVAALLREAAKEVLAYMAFPPEHWRQVHSTDVLERPNREVARRFDVVGIFGGVQAVLRLLGALLAEQQDEWEVQRRYLSQASMAKLKASTGAAVLAALMARGGA